MNKMAYLLILLSTFFLNKFTLKKYTSMKKLMMTAVMGVLFLVGLTSMISTPPPPPFDCNSACTELVGAGLFPTAGACQSACRTCTNPSNGNYAVCICKNVGAFEDDPLLGEKNMGQCLQLVKGN